MHIFEPVPKSRAVDVSRFAAEYPRMKFKVCQEVADDLEPGMPVLSVCVGDWVLVKYDDVLYPGEVREVGDKEVKVSAMIKSGKYYKWPTSENCIYYAVNNVVMKLQPPTVQSARGTFNFTEKW